jgi:hypothetical protein
MGCGCSPRASDAPRSRRPSDVVLLALAVLTVVALTFAAPGPTSIDLLVTDLVQGLPGLFGWFWELAYDPLLTWTVVLGALALCSRGRKRLLFEEALAGALATAVIVTASPYMARPFRYAGRGCWASGPPPGSPWGRPFPSGWWPPSPSGAAGRDLRPGRLGRPAARLRLVLAVVPGRDAAPRPGPPPAGRARGLRHAAGRAGRGRGAAGGDGRDGIRARRCW